MGCPLAQASKTREVLKIKYDLFAGNFQNGGANKHLLLQKQTFTIETIGGFSFENAYDENSSAQAQT